MLTDVIVSFKVMVADLWQESVGSGDDDLGWGVGVLGLEPRSDESAEDLPILVYLPAYRALL